MSSEPGLEDRFDATRGDIAAPQNREPRLYSDLAQAEFLSLSLTPVAENVVWLAVRFPVLLSD